MIRSILKETCKRSKLRSFNNRSVDGISVIFRNRKIINRLVITSMSGNVCRIGGSMETEIIVSDKKYVRFYHVYW